MSDFMLWLWPPSELPISPPVETPAWRMALNKLRHKAGKAGKKPSRQQIKTLYERVQLNFDHLFNRPVVEDVVKRKAKVKNRKFGDWEDAPVFTGSVTLNLHSSEEDQSQAIPEWSSAHLWEAHCWVFDEAMEALKAVGNKEEKIDILQWIFSPSFIEKVGKTHDGHPCIIRQHASYIPYSYVNCCRAVGISDPDTFREMLVEHMSDEFRPQLKKYLQVTQGKLF